MKITDNDIITWYMHGFRDELSQTYRTAPEGLLTEAYDLGKTHALIGDDVRSVDYLTNKEILKMIKGI